MSTAKAKPVFVKVETLRPATKGHNLVVKVRHTVAGGLVFHIMSGIGVGQ